MFPPVKQISYGIREDQSSMQQGLLQFKSGFSPSCLFIGLSLRQQCTGSCLLLAIVSSHLKLKVF
jgi:hypothetical protein